MQLQSKFFLTVSVVSGLVATFLLLAANDIDGGRRMEAADVTADPALEPEHRELSRHWFKKTHNPNGLKTWRRNKWAFYVGKQKKGRAYRYYADRPGWNPHPNKPNQKKKSLRVVDAGGVLVDAGGVQPGCSCTFRDNDGIAYNAMTPAIFGDDYICGACQGFGAFKMAVMDLAGQQTASKYFPCPSADGATSADLTRTEYNGATNVDNDPNFYTAPEGDFSSCPEDTGKCTCMFLTNEGKLSPEVTPKTFGEDYVCGACMVDSDGKDTYFKMAVLDANGSQTASKFIGGVCSDDPANPGFTIADLDEDGYNTASPSASTAYPAQEADFSSCPAADETPPAVEDPNRGLCSCTFMDNQGNEYGAMTPAIFGDAYVCGGCQGTGDFKMVVLDSAGAAQPNGRYFPCPSENGATAEDLTLAQFEGARRTFTENPYSAPIVDFSGC